MKTSRIFFGFILLLVIFNIEAYSALKPRWIPLKPVSTTVDSSVYKDCITVKFIENSRVRLRNSELISESGYSLDKFQRIVSSFKILSIERLFSRPEIELEKEKLRGQERSGKELADLNNYYRLILSKKENSSEFINSLNALDIIEIAYAEPVVELPEDIEPETDDFTELQGYLYDAPEGINAPAAWEHEGGRGEDVKIIDIEGGWNFDHEDFKEPFYSNLDDVDPLWENHGDAVIGIMIGQHNGYGIDGICPEAEIGGHSMVYLYPDDGFPNVAEAINATAAELDEGDIYLIELHAQFDRFMSPMETWQANYDVIETSTANGVICAEAGGNGNSDLDAEVYEGRFDPENRHSGAILVGAGNPPEGNWGVDRSRASFSNYGQRVDLQGWGWSVTSAGYGNLFFPNNDFRQWYTRHFGGTSSATPIVAGAVACVQGIYKARANGEDVLTGMEIRDILVETGSPQNEEGLQGHIGPRPNLTNIRDQLIIPGILYGSVRDFATDEVLAGAEIISDNGYSVITDENGSFRIVGFRAEIEFSLTASMEGYNDSTDVNLIIEEADSLEVRFALLHPEFGASVDSFEESLEPGDSSEHEFSLENRGNGPLYWSFEKGLPGEAGADLGELKRSLFVGDSLEDDRIQGVIYADNQFYICGSNDSNPTIYILDRNGALIDTFAQPGNDNRGMKDLTFDGELIWGTIQNTVYGFSLDGELSSTFQSPYNPTTNIAWDSSRDCLWLSSVTTDPVAYTREGEPIENLQIDRRGFRIYGMTYWDQDPDGYQLYLFHRSRENNIATLHKVNIEMDDTIFVTELIPEIEGSIMGSFITNDYDIFSWTFINIGNTASNAGSDRIDCWQLKGLTEWFDCEVETDSGRVTSENDTINPGEMTEFSLILNTENLRTTTYDGELQFWHNAAGLHNVIEISLEVFGARPPGDFSLLSPVNEDTLSAVEIEFVWQESVDPNQNDLVSYELWLQTDEDSVYFEAVDTIQSVNLDSLNLEIIDNSILSWWVNALSIDDIVESSQRFSFLYSSLYTDERAHQIPYKFELQSIYPNPFNSMATIGYSLNQKTNYDVSVYNCLGKKIKSLDNGNKNAGNYKLFWDAANVPSGIYFIHLNTPSKAFIQKVVLMR